MLGSLGMEIEAGMFSVPQTICNILCCICGIPMQPNAANMCVKCLSSQEDITEGLQKQIKIYHCPECESYLQQQPKTWIKYLRLESDELLKFCLNMLKKKLSTNKVRVVDARFIWTEPHSKRIKVNVKVQKEVLNGVILEQSYLVEYVQLEHLCDSCTRLAANPDQWVAVVQLRQHVSHRRTFFYLEQLILKHGVAATAIRIKQMDEGIDFYFSNKSHGNKFVQFIQKVAPIRSNGDNRQLVSHDTKSNTYNYRYTYSVEISPICREDLICLPHHVALSLGNIGPLVICTKVTNSIVLLDPFTLRHCSLDANQYWGASFKSLLTSRQLVEYVVLDVEEVVPSEVVTVGGTKYALAVVEVARVSDFGKNDTIFSIKTHLGHLLNPGDYALGYDLYGANCNNIELDIYKGDLPHAILVKKSYEEKRLKKRGKPRSWKLKSLNMEVDDKGRIDPDKMNSEYEQFLNDLEENPDLRFNLSLYQNIEFQPSEMASVTDGEELPSVPLEELLADLELGEDEDEDDFMME